MQVIDDGDIFILDIASSMADVCQLDFELYTAGLAHTPAAFWVDESRPLYYGQIRRPGVLWVEAEEYKFVEEQIEGFFTTGSNYSNILKSRMWENINKLNEACDRYVPGQQLDEIWYYLCQLMGFTAFNWLIPRDILKKQLQELAHYTYEEATQWLLLASIPEVTPHFFRYRSRLLELTLKQCKYNNLDQEEAIQFVTEFGYLKSPAIPLPPFETIDQVKEEVANLIKEIGTVPAIELEKRNISESRVAALKVRQSAVSSALARAIKYKGQQAMQRVDEIAKLLGLASEEEEERHIAQLRAYSFIRKEALFQGFTLESLNCAKLGLDPLPIGFACGTQS